MPRATVQFGSHGDDVKRVQRYFIRARQLDPTHLDGDFGPETKGLVSRRWSNVVLAHAGDPEPLAA